jgi:GTP cyclohydrolase IB
MTDSFHSNPRHCMNTRDHTLFLPDVQQQQEMSDLSIQAVGVKGVRYPLLIHCGAQNTPTVAQLSMTVALPAGVKGTHMSRFMELLEAQVGPLDAAGFKAMVFEMLQRLGAASGAIEMSFPYFVRKTAPVSGVSSLLDVDVQWRGAVDAAGRYCFFTQVVVAATSLCPCSKEISSYGAHNQRSHIRIDCELKDFVSIEELVALAERSASCEVYGLLKRVDEKFVTERAYDNPKFVEDLVRDLALLLNGDHRLGAYVVEAENFESIHNHSAFARIERLAAAGALHG